LALVRQFLRQFMCCLQNLLRFLCQFIHHLPRLSPWLLKIPTPGSLISPVGAFIPHALQSISVASFHA
jgi:hypothetical protein